LQEHIEAWKLFSSSPFCPTVPPDKRLPHSHPFTISKYDLQCHKGGSCPPKSLYISQKSVNNIKNAVTFENKSQKRKAGHSKKCCKLMEFNAIIEKNSNA
jgi:hypothetical protein